MHDDEVAEELAARLLEAHEQLETPSHVDGLTGLLNRPGFLIVTELEAQVIRRTGTKAVVVFVGVDGPEPLDDTRRDVAGDDLLRAVADGLKAACREFDVVARYANDEFVALLADFDGSVDAVTQRLRYAVTDAGIVASGEVPAVTIGVAVLDSDDDRPVADLIAEAASAADDARSAAP